MDYNGGFLRSRYCYWEKTLSDFECGDNLKTILVTLRTPFNFCNSTQYCEEGDFEYSPEGKSENLVMLSCVEIVVTSQDDLQGYTITDKIGIGSIIKIVGEDNVGIIKEIANDSITVDIYYEKDNYLVEPHQRIVNENDILLANDEDFRFGYLRYLSRREYLHIYSKRDKERMAAVLYQVKKACETYSDLRLGQLLLGCCANDNVMFGIKDELLMEQLHKVFLDKNKL